MKESRCIQQFIIYLLTGQISTWLLYFVLLDWLHVGLRFTILLSILMPLLCMLGNLIFFREMNWLKTIVFRYGKVKYLMAAWALPIIYWLLSYFVLRVFYGGSGFPTPNRGWVISVITINFMVLPIFNFIFAQIEEIAWRGYFEILRKRLNLPIYINGLAWGIWHIPLVYRGLNGYDSFLMGCLFTIFYCVILGSILVHLVERSGSIYPAVICHTMINSISNGTSADLFLNSEKPIGGPTGIIAQSILLMIYMTVFYWGTSREKRKQVGEYDGSC